MNQEKRRARLKSLCASCSHGDNSASHSVNSYQNECQEFAECCGFLLRRFNSDCGQKLCLGSTTICPSRIPKSAFYLALEVQPCFNELYFRVSNDYEFLKACFESAIHGDEFIRKLWNIYEQTHSNSMQQISLCLLRSDYMYQIKGDKLAVGQIEVNTIASSMACHSSTINQLHRHMGALYPDDIQVDTLPSAEGQNVLARGLAAAWRAYNNPRAIILFVLSDATEGNFSDIRKLQYSVMNQAGCPVHRATFESLVALTTLSEDQALLVDDKEVAVVYFRCAYVPTHFTHENLWELRLKLEQSRAIKCPNIAYHLAGSKKVQQELTKPGAVERYLSADKASKVRQTFVNILSLSEPDDVIEEALKRPDDYVLKPQREGGGHNFYGSSIITKWREIKDKSDRDAYILMERIRPPVQYNCVLPCDPDNCHPIETINELGVYGAVLGDNNDVIYSESGGYLLRTKPVNVDEGGFFTGFSSIDTPSLMDDEEFIAFVSQA